MTKREERDKVVQLLYLRTFGGEFKENDFPETVVRTCEQVLEKQKEIDEIITKNLTKWTIDRLNYVDRAIIEYAVYEMKYANLAYEIAINEAIELTKKYSNLDDDLAKRFNNKLLDNIKSYLINS